MVKKYKKSSKKKYNKASMKDVLGEGGEISSSTGVVMAWIVSVISILIGIFMIVIGIYPGLVSNNNGICSANNTDPSCVYNNDKGTCQDNTSCSWKESNIHGGLQVAYILGGIGLIAFSICIIIFSYWWNRKVHENLNITAFSGEMF